MTEHLQAATVELLDDLRRITLQVHGAKPHQVPEPIRIQRPGQERPVAAAVPPPAPTRRHATVEEMQAFFAAGVSS